MLVLYDRTSTFQYFGVCSPAPQVPSTLEFKQVSPTCLFVVPLSRPFFLVEEEALSACDGECKRDKQCSYSQKKTSHSESRGVEYLSAFFPCLLACWRRLSASVCTQHDAIVLDTCI